MAYNQHASTAAPPHAVMRSWTGGHSEGDNSGGGEDSVGREGGGGRQTVLLHTHPSRSSPDEHNCRIS